MAPWPTDADIEQDLILSRLIVEIANNELLGGELTMRGGTCLHKLYLPAPLRYSEDLDYVRRTRSGIGPYMDALRTIATGVGLVDGGRTQVGQMVHMAFTADSTHGQRRLRIKIEMNIRETESCFPRTSRPYQVLSSWWSGRAGVNTFQLEELLGTKLRPLYQRRKGRDLFDLWHFLTATSVTDERIVQAFHHYTREGAFTYPDLAANLSAKLASQDFASDLSELVVAPPPNYDLAGAADLVMERLGSRLANAPRLDEIAGGGWRSDARRL